MKLSAEAVLEIAQKIERNAVAYYEGVAEYFPAYRKDILSLKMMEENHVKLFLAMQDALEGDQRSKLAPDPFGELDTYLQAFADTSGGEGRLLEIRSFTGKESFDEVIATSIKLERESILFYRKIEPLLVKDGMAHIDAIVEEENKHIKILERLRETKCTHGGNDGR